MGFKQRRITPLNPRANGLVENFNRMIAKVLKIARIECKPWKTGLLAFLLNYRATIHLTTITGRIVFCQTTVQNTITRFKEHDPG